jgi:hypothetical protein
MCIFANYKLLTEAMILLHISKGILTISACKMAAVIYTTKCVSLSIQNLPNSHSTYGPNCGECISSVCPITISTVFCRNGQPSDASTPLLKQIVGTVSTHNNHTLCKSSALNSGIRQVLFDALYAVFRQVVAIWFIPLCTYLQICEDFEAFSNCCSTLVSDAVVDWVTPLLTYAQLSEIYEAFGDSGSTLVSEAVVGWVFPLCTYPQICEVF